MSNIDLSQLVTAEVKELAALVETRARIANRRWQAETGGTSIQGLPVPTDRESQALITGATVQAMIDPAYKLNFKTAAGFVALDAKTVIGMAMAVRRHVQACFDREAALLDALDAETFTEAMLEEGWPPAG